MKNVMLIIVVVSLFLFGILIGSVFSPAKIETIFITTTVTGESHLVKVLTSVQTLTRTYTETFTVKEVVTETATSTVTETRIRLPRLAVRGNRLVAEGEEVVLKGVAIADPCFLDWEGRFEEELFDELKGWGVNVVRVPIHPVFWKRYPDYSERYLDKIIEWSAERGIYVIIDWHAIGNPKTGETEVHEWFKWEPWRGLAYDANFSLAVSAWHTIAERYKDETNVLYEIFNEPTWISWSEWKPLAEKLIDVIREHDPDALVLVGGVDWAYDLRGVVEDPINRSNIVYAAHVYPGRPRETWGEYWGNPAELKPVMVTEWGFEEKPEYAGYLRGTREDFGEPLISYMEGRVAGWVAWIFHPSWEPNMIKDWNYTPTDFGLFVKGLLSRDNQG